MKIKSLHDEFVKLGEQEPILDLVKKDFLDNLNDYMLSLKNDDEQNYFQTIIKNSTSIEGINEETALENQKSLYLELGRQQAVSILVKDLINKPITCPDIRLIGEVKLGFSDFRKNEVFIKKGESETLTMPSPIDVLPLLQELLDWLDKEFYKKSDRILLIAEFHHRFERIHPFLDGNGRIGRLLVDILLLKFGYLPIRIPKEKRFKYFEALNYGDKGDINPLKDFFEELETETLEYFLRSPNVQSIKEKINLRNKLREVTGDYDTLVLTEDTKTDNLLEIVFESSGFDLSKTKFLSYEGCTNISSVNLFSIYVKEKFTNICLIVHRDRDYLTDKEVQKFQQATDQIKLNLFITKGTDVESYFLNEHHINFCHPAISKERALELINESIQLCREKSINNIRKKEFGEKYAGKYSHLENAIVELFDNNPMRFTHGKDTLKRLKGLIQSELKANTSLFQPSQFLCVHELEIIKNNG